jgi:TolB-like protein/Tfp pilus assembly protein PilF/tRNA A-37 threonylcarbamoyl transferase component Bud32
VAITCPKCHSENPETKQFCADCGTQLVPQSKDIHPDVTETLQTPVRELTTGSTFAGRYQVIEELGHGGMGKVYKVYDTEIKEKIALKLIKSDISVDHETIERFRNELKFARKIRHKNVCQMFDLAKEEGSYYITMEYVYGEDLKRLIRKMGQLSPGQAILIAKQVCEGLAEAHKLGVVHRDLKPQNIMVDEEGNARIMDFGIARSLKIKGITGAGVMIGTPEYMSPEQVQGKDVDQRSDIYSLGIILYELVTGRVPFEGDTPFTIGVKQKSEIPKNPKQINPNIPEDLSGIILKCLEKDKSKRYQTAGEVHSELEKIEKGIPTTERVIPEKKAFTSKEITVTFGLKKALLPILGLLFLVIAAVVIWKIFPKKETAPAAAAKKSIAVLPFEDLSQAKNNEYLCDGISETLINALTNIEGLWVPARTSAFSFKGKTQDIREIGQKLGVGNVLEGSVQVAGDNLRVTARISNVQDGRQVWSEIFNRKMADMFVIQDDIAKAIVTALKIRLLGEEGAPFVKNYTENLEAYSLYLQGRNFWNKRGEADLIKSIEYFEKAIEIDPNYTLAYAGLGDAYYILGNNGYWPAEKAFPKAKAAALKALGIDDKLAEAHASLASIIFEYDWDFVDAEKEFKLAIELNPGYATAHHFYAYHLSILGRHEEAMREIEIARKLDPLSPRISANVGLFLYFERQYGQAIEELNKALEVDPNHFATYLFLGWAYEAMGKYEEAVRCYLRASELGGRSKFGGSFFASCYALMGKQEEARKILYDMIEYSKRNYIPSVAIAWVFSALGEKEQAFAWLEKAFRDRDPYLIMYLRNVHIFDAVRSDPRYAALLRKIGLEK